MKKNVSSILVVFVVLVFVANFSACEKFKVSNLKANYQLKKANGYYMEEKYKKAVECYEEALSFNPEMKFIYLYLGTSYSSIYRPGKDDDPRNKTYAEKGIQYLKMAEQNEPENETVVLALGDLYDKLGNIEEAEKCYLKILSKKADDPKSYYTLANFYSKNNKIDSADAMYLKRIELNPQDAEGYHYYVGFLQDQRRWSDAVTNHEKRLYALLDPSIVMTIREVGTLKQDAESITKIESLIATYQKNTKVDKAEKQRLIDEAKQKLEGKLSLDATNKKIAELQAQIQERITKAETTIQGFDEKKKQEIAEAYYSIGNVCWNWSYQSPEDVMSAQERDPIIEKGMRTLQKAIDILPDYANPYSYMGLLWREKIKINAAKKDEYVKKNEEYNKKFINIYQRVQKSEAYRKELEDIGKEEK